MKAIVFLFVVVILLAFDPLAWAGERERVRVALALAEAEIAARQPVAKPDPPSGPKAFRDMSEAKREAESRGVPLVVWVDAKPCDVPGCVAVIQDEHAGITKAAAIVYPIQAGKVASGGDVEYKPTADSVRAAVRKVANPSAAVSVPVKAQPQTVTQPFFVQAPRIEVPGAVCVGPV